MAATLGCAVATAGTDEGCHSYSVATGKIGGRDRNYGHTRYFKCEGVNLAVGDGMGVPTVAAGRILDG